MHKERIMSRRSSFCCFCIVAVLSIGNVFAADKETIAIIGTGDLGDSFGARLAALGYPIVYGSRTPDSEKSQGVVKATGHGAKSAAVASYVPLHSVAVLPVPL